MGKASGRAGETSQAAWRVAHGCAGWKPACRSCGEKGLLGGRGKEARNKGGSVEGSLRGGEEEPLSGVGWGVELEDLTEAGLQDGAQSWGRAWAPS